MQPRGRSFDRLVVMATTACVVVSCGVLGFLLYAIASRGLPALSWSFLTEEMSGGGARGGIASNLIGTLILIGTAAFVCTPLAVGTALTHGYFLKSPAAKRRLELVLYMLNGVPSILFGLAGLIVFVGFLGWGKSWLSGGILLALIMVPTVSVAMMERIAALPRSYFEAAVGLGLSDAQVVRAVILPRSAGALVTGLLLGLARAAGETAPILFTATVFAGASFPQGVRESPVLSLPYHVFVLTQDSFEPAMAENAWGAATVLIFLVVGLSAVALPLRLRIHDEAQND